MCSKTDRRRETQWNISDTMRMGVRVLFVIREEIKHTGETDTHTRENGGGTGSSIVMREGHGEAGEGRTHSFAFPHSDRHTAFRNLHEARVYRA